MSTWVGTELICRAVQMILDGALHGGTETELASELGVSARHLRRRFREEVGTTPVQLARSGRAHFARRLLDDTSLSISEIAFASGFGSVRQFNRTMSDIFREPPRRLRARRRSTDRLAADGGLALRLPVAGPVEVESMLSVLVREAIPGVEDVSDGWYRRTIEVDGDPGVLEVGPGDTGYLIARLHLPHWEGLIHQVRRARRIFRLDADHRHLGDDAVSWLRSEPGSGDPGAWDVLEIGVRAIVLRQGDESTLSHLVEALGKPVPGLSSWNLTHLFPSPATLLRVDLDNVGLDDKTNSLLVGFVSAYEAAVGLNGRVEQATLRAACMAAGLPGWLADSVSRRLPGDHSGVGPDEVTPATTA